MIHAQGLRRAFGTAQARRWVVDNATLTRAHMVALVHLDAKWAAILDNNNVSKFIWVPRETLIAEWKASYGWAVTPIYTPAAPLPQ